MLRWLFHLFEFSWLFDVVARRAVGKRRRVRLQPSGGEGLTLMLFGNSGAACSEVTYENSPEFQRREGGLMRLSPDGTAEWKQTDEAIQPSVRDSAVFVRCPGVETPGYCWMSLRDNAAARAYANFRKALGLTREAGQRNSGQPFLAAAPCGCPTAH